jgi:hypothetical protein
VRRIDVEERRARLVRRHRLGSDAARSAVEVARSLVALHSTDAATVFLSVRARTRGLSAADVERELYDERTLVRMLGMRRTLFVVPRELVPVVQAACTGTIAARERKRLVGFVAASDLSTRPEAWLTRALNAVQREVEERGEAFTADVAKAVPAAGKKLRLGVGTRFEATQSAAARILPQLAMEGRLVRGRPRGTWANGQYRWVPVAAWLGAEIERREETDAQAELARLWLRAFGPATETDLRWWTGWTAREARRALAVVPHVVVDLEGGDGLLLEDDLEPVEPSEPCAALLSTLDATTMGWKERSWYLGAHERILFDRNGNAGPTVWWGGRVVGGWSQRREGEIVFRLLEDVGSEAIAAIEAEVQRLAAWIGDTRLAPGFLPPFQRELAA